jgi:hypothetical protein
MNAPNPFPDWVLLLMLIFIVTVVVIGAGLFLIAV